MDNLTHSLVGLAAAKAGLERVSPYATAVCVLAANLPDADIVTLAAGPAAYLEHHRGITHSIVGALVLGAALPLLLVGVDRLVARLRGREPRARLRGLLVASLLVTASHPLLDWTNSYGLRPFLPWSGRWYYGDLVFVIDPWLWLLLGGACFLLTSPTRTRLALWSVLWAGIAAAILFLPMRRGFDVPPAAQLLWPVCLGCVALARWARGGARKGGAVAACALAAVVFYWGALAVVQARARSVAAEFARSRAEGEGERLTKVAAMPTLLNPFKWLCAAETDRTTLRFELDSSSLFSDGEPSLISRHAKPQGASAAAVERAGRDERVRVLLDFARFPVAQVWPAGEGASVVRVTDVRFGEPAPPGERARGSFAAEATVSAQ